MKNVVLWVGMLCAVSLFAQVRNGDFAKGKEAWWGEGKWQAADSALQVQSGYVCQDKISVEGGKRYKISFRGKGQGAYAQLSWRGGGVDGGWYGPASVKMDWGNEKALALCVDGDVWKTYSAVVKAPAGVNQALIYLRKMPKSEGVAYYDDVTLVETQEQVVRPVGTVFGVIKNGDFAKGKETWWGEGTWNVVNQALCVQSGFACQDNINVEGGKRYKLSLRMKCEGLPEDGAYVQVSYRGDGVDGGWRGPRTVKLPWGGERAVAVDGGTKDWTTYSCVLAPPDGAEQMLVYLRKRPKVEGTVWYDDVTLSETQEAETTAAALRREVLAKQVFGGAPGNGEYRIVVSENCDLIELNAAKELAEYLGQITGKHYLPLLKDTDKIQPPYIAVGRGNKLLSTKPAWEKLGADGFVVQSDGNVYLAGGTPGATMYAVNWFLDHQLGVKWLAPDYTFVPKRSQLSISKSSTVQVPRFNFRQILGHEGQDKAFAAHNLLNGSSHGAYSIIPPAEIDHFDYSWQRPGMTASFYQLLPPKDHQAKNPQWYAGGQLAMMNDGMRAALADAIGRRLAKEPNYGDYWFGLMDNDWGWDMDGESRAFAQKHGCVPSAPLFDMVKDVARRVQQKYPKAKFASNAYHWGFNPPRNLEIPDSIRVFPMTIHLDYSTPLNVGRNVHLGRDLEQWNATAKNILLWDHVVNFHGFIQPTPNLYPIAETIKWLDGLKNIQGYFAEASWNTKGSEFASLRTWLMARLLWDPKADYKKAVEEYCDAYFGAAGKIMRDYIDYMHVYSVQTRSPIWEKVNVDAPMLTLDFIVKADAMMAQAAQLVKDDPVRLKHVNQVRVTIDYVALLRRQEFEREAAKRGIKWNSDRANRTARAKAIAEAEGIKQYRQSGPMSEFFEIIEMDRKPSALPVEFANVKPENIREVQDLGFNRYYNTTVLVTDPKASDGITARLEGKNGAPLIQAKHHLLPEEGEWDVYAQVRVEADGAADDDKVGGVGSMPPMGVFTEMKWKDFKDGEYHLVKAKGGPFSYSGDEGAICYVCGSGNAKTKYIYVDRFIFVRVK